MAHPYESKRQDKVGKERAKEFVAKKADGGEAMKPISKPNARSITEVGVRAYGRELGRDPATGRMGSNPYKAPVDRKTLDEEMPRKEGGRIK